MLTQILWWAGNVMVSLLLLRAFVGKFLTKYPALYLYLSYVLLESLVSFYVYFFRAEAYRDFYWYTAFLGLALAYCVIWEIYSQSLAKYPGVRRMAHILLLGVYLIVIASMLLAYTRSSLGSLAQTVAVLERHFRVIQAGLLLGIIALLTYYAIPISRNLKGMIIGYGIYVAGSLVALTLRFKFWQDWNAWWAHLQPTTYCLGLLIWCTTLWSYYPNPPAKNDIDLEQDYEILTARMVQAIAKARNSLVKGVEP